ncbi:MAG: M50 family metallopeptidase [Chloroflexi bacterium]|nr:M50 family metallopeptidase [Chloroflexota bacterium]
MANGWLKSVKDLLYYNLKRYHSLPISHLSSLVATMRQEKFLHDTPTNLYQQVADQLQAREPASRGQRLLQGFLHTEVAWDGLDGYFSTLHRWTRWLFSRPMQFLLLVIIFLGGALYARLFFTQEFRLISGGLSVFTIILANIVVILLHELAHGLTVKQVGRELNRGGFLLYWGLPAFFVDTRDTWLSSNRERIAVSWAGPHSGLIVGGLTGIALSLAAQGWVTAVSPTLLTSFIFQIGFIAYLSVFVNLNPLLELDGYFILMDWLDMPGLRQRAFRYWRESVWRQRQTLKRPRAFWQKQSRDQRLYLAYGALAFVYSVYALGFALYFWQSRFAPLVGKLWTEYGWGGRALLLGVITAVVVPTVYYLIHFGWSRIQAGLEWLARHDLLARVDVLALLLGAPLLVGLPTLLLTLWLLALPYGDLAINALIWLVFLATLTTMTAIARQLPGSRFQWSVWSLTLAFGGLTPRLVEPALVPDPHQPGLDPGGGQHTRRRRHRLAHHSARSPGNERTAAHGRLLFTWPGNPPGHNDDGRGNWLLTLLILAGIIPGLIFLTPLLFNFWHSRFALPWLLLVLAVLLIPWLQFYTALYVPVAVLWLYAAALYLLLGTLTRFSRSDVTPETSASFNERQRLLDAFNHFMQAFFLELRGRVWPPSLANDLP